MLIFVAQKCPAMFYKNIYFVVTILGVFINPLKAVSQEPPKVINESKESKESKVSLEIEGPVAMETGKTLKLVLHNYDTLKDVKIKCTPENPNWESLRRLDGTPIIMFNPDTAGVYTFAIAGNKDGKTTLIVHSVLVVLPEKDQPQLGPQPQPPPPAPKALPEGKYTKQLKPLFNLKTEAEFESLVKLIDIYTSMAKETNLQAIKSTKQLLDALSIATRDINNNFSALKVEVTAILTKELPTSSYDPELVKTTLNEITKSIKALIPQ